MLYNSPQVAFNLSGLSPAELEQRRRDLIAKIQAYPLRENDPNVDLSILQELAAVLSMRRRGNAGPPKEPSTRKKGSKPPPSSADSLGDLI